MITKQAEEILLTNNTPVADTHTFSYRGRRYKVNDIIRYLNNKKNLLMSYPLENYSMLAKNMSLVWKNTRAMTGSTLLKHLRRIFNADLTCPIVYLKDRNRILDGHHRVFSALARGNKEIPAYGITLKDLEKIPSVPKK